MSWILTCFRSLKRMHLNVRKMDLRIAAVVLDEPGTDVSARDAELSELLSTA